MKGTKVYDPHAIIQEKPGPITADSLAAESSKTGGSFSKNPNSEPQSVTGAHSTFTNTDTSGATRLDPASDAEARMAQNDWAEERKLSGGVLKKYDAPGDSDMISRSSEKTSESANDAGRHETNPYERFRKPKGKNLQEGGFDSDAKNNASFHSDIGTENDPSREAEYKFETLNADGDVGIPRQRRISGGARYNALDNEAAA